MKRFRDDCVEVVEFLVRKNEASDANSLSHPKKARTCSVKGHARLLSGVGRRALDKTVTLLYDLSPIPKFSVRTRPMISAVPTQCKGVIDDSGMSGDEGAARN